MAGSRVQYLIVQAEGGCADGAKLYDGRLDDYTLTIGRSAAAQVRMPAGESAIGQHHCKLRIEGNVVWLDPIDHQEVYLDPDGAESPDKSRVTEPTRLLPSGAGGRVLELGGLSRTAGKRDARHSGFSQTRVRVMLSDTPNSPVETRQAIVSRKNRNALDWSSLAWRAFVVVGLAGGIGYPAWAAMGGVGEANQKLVGLQQQVENLGRQLSSQEFSLTGQYERLMTAMDNSREQTIGILKSLPAELRDPPPPPPHFPVSKESVWLAGYSYVDTDGRKKFAPVATAWVMAGHGFDQRKSIITNKHVVEVLRAAADRGDIAIRQTGADNQPITLLLDEQALKQTDTVHPDFQKFSDFRLTEARRPPGANVFDVGRLVLADPAQDAQLGEGLRVADRPALEGLKVDDAIEYIGYPYENLSDAGVNPDRPQTMLLRGRVIRLSDAFRQPADGAAAQLIVVDAPAMGGASGSPVFHDGKVIGLLSGGDVLEFGKSALTEASRNTLGTTLDKFRMPTGFSYVIRSDVAVEIARKEYADRAPQWRDLLAAGKTDESDALRDWKTARCGAADVQPVRGSHLLDADGRYQAEIRPPKTGQSRFYSAVAVEGRPAIRNIERMKLTDKPGPSSRVAVLNFETYFNFRSDESARIVFSGVPLTKIDIEEYVCPLSAPPAAASGAAQ